MGDEVQEVRIVGQRLSVDDGLQTFDAMIGALEVLVRDPIRILRVMKLVKAFAELQETLGA